MSRNFQGPCWSNVEAVFSEFSDELSNKYNRMKLGEIKKIGYKMRHDLLPYNKTIIV